MLRLLVDCAADRLRAALYPSARIVAWALPNVTMVPPSPG